MTGSPPGCPIVEIVISIDRTPKRSPTSNACPVNGTLPSVPISRLSENKPPTCVPVPFAPSKNASVNWRTTAWSPTPYQWCGLTDVVATDGARRCQHPRQKLCAPFEKPRVPVGANKKAAIGIVFECLRPITAPRSPVQFNDWHGAHSGLTFDAQDTWSWVTTAERNSPQLSSFRRLILASAAMQSGRIQLASGSQTRIRATANGVTQIGSALN